MLCIAKLVGGSLKKSKLVYVIQIEIGKVDHLYFNHLSRWFVLLTVYVMVQLEKGGVRQQKGIEEVRSQGGPSFYSCVLLNKCCICLPNAINSF